jgi:hypothetical protein
VSSDSRALKTYAYTPSLLEEKALTLLKEVSQEGRFVPYNEAAYALTRLRVDRKMALRLLAEFSRRGILQQSCGHGVRIIEGAARNG